MRQVLGAMHRLTRTEVPFTGTVKYSIPRGKPHKTGPISFERIKVPRMGIPTYLAGAETTEEHIKNYDLMDGKYLGYIDAPRAVPYYRIVLRSEGIMFKSLKFIYQAYSDINKRLLELVVEEYQSYIRAGRAPGVDVEGPQFPAIGRGESDPASLINALKVVAVPGDDITKWEIQVCNKVWLYQEYGFDMHGKLPPREVAEKILLWAIDKGLVQMLKSQKQKEVSKSGRVYRKYRIRSDAPQRSSSRYEIVDREYYYDIRTGFGEFFDPLLTQFMWKITGAVVKNSAMNNRHLFLTTAYRNIMGNKQLVRQVEREYLTLS